MKIVIDEQVCLKHKMTVGEALMALAIRTSKNVDEDLQSMRNREILVYKDNQYLVTQHWSEVIDEIICDSSKATEMSDETLLEFAQKLRNVYPSGKMPGTAFYYRCNNSEVAKKLKKFFLQYGTKYSEQDILDATQRYVASFRGNYRYLPLIKYFISKLKPVQEEDGTTHNVEFSPLADYLENKEEEGVEVTNYDEWMCNVKN